MPPGTPVPPAALAPRAGRGRLVLALALIVGLILRLGVLIGTRTLDTRIVDEQQYSQIATSLLNGNGFAWGPGQPTSIRPPLYPMMLAAIWRVTGPRNLVAVRVVQVALALMTTWIVFRIGRRAFGPETGRYAAAVFWLYPSFIFFNALILTETLFTCLFVAFIYLAIRLLDRQVWTLAVSCGIVLGLAALARSVLWPLPLVLCPVLVWLVPGPARTRLATAALVLAGYVVAVGPWAIRNTRLQHVVEIVDTMGGMNLRMGNYEYTPDDRMWAAVDLKGHENWAYALSQEHPGETFTEGQKEKWAQRKAIEYIREHPLTTIRRGLIKFGDLFGLEREFVAGVQQGLFNPPMWFAIPASLLIVLAFPVLALAGAAGLWLARPAWRIHVLILLPTLAIIAGHVLAFGHSRYHLPLVPILALYAVALCVNIQSSPGRIWRGHPIATTGAALTMLALVTIWIRSIVIVDAERIHSFLSGL